MRLVSWNINGIRAAVGKGLERWVEATRPDVFCLQGTRDDSASVPEGYAILLAITVTGTPLRQKGHGGIATFCRQPAAAWRAGLAMTGFDDEERTPVTDVGDVTVYNVYFPNGKASPARLAYKLAFYAAFLDRIDAEVQSGRCVVFCGDVNTAHHSIDLARPMPNANRSGFLPEERVWLDRWVARWVDTFRHLHPDAESAYTRWDLRTHARARNVGWRLDYCFIHERWLSRVSDAGIAAELTALDHCPMWLKLAGGHV